MDSEKVNRLAKQLVALCIFENPDLNENELRDDAKKAVETMLYSQQPIMPVLERDENLVLLFAKNILANSKQPSLRDSLFGKSN